jgi:hypothetical protein
MFFGVQVGVQHPPASIPALAIDSVVMVRRLAVCPVMVLHPVPLLHLVIGVLRTLHHFHKVSMERLLVIMYPHWGGGVFTTPATLRRPHCQLQCHLLHVLAISHSRIPIAWLALYTATPCNQNPAYFILYTDVQRGSLKNGVDGCVRCCFGCQCVRSIYARTHIPLV